MKNKIMALLFVVCLTGIALISDYKLINFYVRGETDYNEWNSSTDKQIETDYISNFWLKYQYVNLNGALRRLLGQHEMNGIVKLNNGFLTTNNPYITSDAIDQYANQTLMFQKKLEEKGIDYVWFTVPYVVDKFDSQIPAGIEDDYGNDNLDRITASFSAKGINTIDLRDILHNQDLKTYDVFYHTDHHWTTEGGFWAYNQIVDYLLEHYDIEIDNQIRDISNYEITTYKQWHLGSRGQRVGKYYAGIDDFDLIIPKFNTYIQRAGTEDGGTMQDMILNMSPLEKSNYMSRYTYDTVLANSYAYWHNPNTLANMKIMIIGDSMSKAVIPYLAITFSDVAYAVYCADVTSVTSSMIDSYQPDIIISLNYLINLGEEAFNWGLNNE